MGKKSRLTAIGLSYEKRVQAAKEREEKVKKEEAEKHARVTRAFWKAMLGKKTV